MHECKYFQFKLHGISKLQFFVSYFIFLNSIKLYIFIYMPISDNYFNLIKNRKKNPRNFVISYNKYERLQSEVSSGLFSKKFQNKQFISFFLCSIVFLQQEVILDFSLNKEGSKDCRFCHIKVTLFLLIMIIN